MQDELIQGNVKFAECDASKPRVRVGQRRASDKQAEVLVQKDGDKIESIVITCPCGQQVTIVCDYA